MFITTISPRFVETDALGHINNTVVPVWFEQARAPIFRFFTPDLDFKKWRLIVAKIEVEYKRELLFSNEVEIKTYLSHIGNSSMVITQEAYQRENLCAKGNATLVHFDYQLKKSSPIPDDIRKLMHEHLSSE